MASLAEQLKAIAERNKVKLSLVVRKTVLDMAGQMVLMSPVDTGRFRSNWQYGAGSINTDTGASIDASGAGSIGRITVGVAAWKPGETMIVSNSLPYAQRLEVGWSKQAPAGVVRTTIASFEAHFARALGEVAQ